MWDFKGLLRKVRCALGTGGCAMWGVCGAAESHCERGLDRSRLCYLQKVRVDFSSCILVTYCNGLEPTSLLPLPRTLFESSDIGARARLLVGGCSLSSLSATDGKELIKLLAGCSPARLLEPLLAADAGLHPALSARADLMGGRMVVTAPQTARSCLYVSKTK